MKIYEPENDRNNVTVTVELPITFYLHGKRSDEEYERIAVQTLRTYAGTIFEHIALLGFLSEGQGLDFTVLHPLLDALGKIGLGLTEGMEAVEMDYARGAVEYYPPRDAEEPRTDNVTALKAA